MIFSELIESIFAPECLVADKQARKFLFRIAKGVT
jgi:hypothetical protein